ncbi:hypothetical protein FKM82_024649 [Ascaphus truei]
MLGLLLTPGVCEVVSDMQGCKHAEPMISEMLYAVASGFPTWLKSPASLHKLYHQGSSDPAPAESPIYGPSEVCVYKLGHCNLPGKMHLQ